MPLILQHLYFINSETTTAMYCMRFCIWRSILILSYSQIKRDPVCQNGPADIFSLLILYNSFFPSNTIRRLSLFLIDSNFHVSLSLS